MPFGLVTTVSEKRLFRPLATVKTVVVIFTLSLTLHDTADERVLLNSFTHFYRLYYRHSPLVNKVSLELYANSQAHLCRGSVGFEALTYEMQLIADNDRKIIATCRLIMKLHTQWWCVLRGCYIIALNFEV